MLRSLTRALLLGLTLQIGTSFAGGSHESIDELSRRLIKLNVQSQQGDSTSRANALSELVNVAALRQQQMSALIADHPEVVLRHALSAQSRATLPATVQGYLEEDLTTDGELEVLHEDGPAGSLYRYFLNRDADRLALHFAADAPVLQTGDRVRVSGIRVQQAMALASGNTTVVQSLAASDTFGAQKTAVILVNFQDKPTQTWVSPAQAQDIVFGTSNATSVTNYYKEASYQQSWLTGDVYGVYTIPVNSTVCDTSSIASYGKAAVAAQVGATKLSSYRRLVYAFPSNGCGWWGLGTVGGNPSQAWINGSFVNGVVTHEMGHNYGLWHSHALDCGQSTMGTSCTGLEYGDVLDVMGSAVPPKHFNAVQKELLGWLNYGVSPPVTTVTTSGTYTIDPYEPVGSQPKALKVKTPAGDWYYVEYRQAIGFDASTVSTNSNVKNGVVVHFWSQSNPNGIYLLDMTGSTDSWSDPALDVGFSFSDATSGISISPVWANSTAGINVTVGGSGGGSTCVRKNPTVTVSPAQQQGTPGTTVGYTISVTNNDVDCASSSFVTDAVVPAGWSAASFAAAALTIGSGATASTTMLVTSPSTASAGPYSISSTVSDSAAPTYSGSAQATYTVAVTGTAGTFSDNFNRADTTDGLGNGWKPVNGTLLIAGGQAANQVNRIMHSAVRPELAGAAQDIGARFASANNQAAPQFALLARYQDSKNYYTCYRRVGQVRVLRIAKVVNGVETVLSSVAVSNPKIGEFFSLGCQVNGTTLTLTFNGATALTVTDSTFQTGNVGISMGYPKGRGSGASHHADDFTASVQ